MTGEVFMVSTIICAGVFVLYTWIRHREYAADTAWLFLALCAVFAVVVAVGQRLPLLVP